MIRKILLLILLLFLTAFNEKKIADIDSLNSQELDEYKTKVEIKKIEKDLYGIDYAKLLQAGTFLTAILALTISIITSNRTNKRQIESLNSTNEHNAKLRISNLLKELGSDSTSVKIAANQALSEYDSALPYIVNLLSIETNKIVISTVIKVLSAKPATSIGFLLEETRSIYSRKLEIAGKLVALGFNRKNVSDELSINNKSLHNWIENKYGSRIKELTDIRIRNKTIAMSKSETDIRAEEKTNLYKEWEDVIVSHYNVIEAIEAVVREADKKKIKLKMENSYLDGLMLVNMDLSKFSFKNSILNYSNFENSDCTNTDFCDVQAKSLNLKNCKFQDAKFDKAILKHSDFRNSKGKRMSMKNAELLSPNFDGVNLKYSNFEGAKLVSMSFKNTLFVKANFSNAAIHNCDISATDLSESNFFNCRIVSSKFSTTRIRNSIFQKSSLYKIDMIKTSFDNSDMSFAKLKKLNSIDCQFTNVNFIGAELFEFVCDDKTKLDGINCENAVFVRCSPNVNQNCT